MIAHALSYDSPDADVVRALLQRILTSDAFSRAPALSRFLGYVVEHWIDGIKTPLKEYTIGVEVFQRGAKFDPQVDTIVRVQARRLRKRLTRYYENEGRADPLQITIPKGRYHAEIMAHPPASQDADTHAAGIAPHAPEARSLHLEFNNYAIPAPRTTLVGRDNEVAAVCAMLSDNSGPRLITLTGPAGTGKTRLAVEVGLQLQTQFSRDLVYLRLENTADTQMLQLALLRALGLHVTDTTPQLEIVCSHLRRIEHAPLLILDNFEQLYDAAPLIGSMLDACGSLKLLVTSRVALHLYGESEYPVVPLALPENDSMPWVQLAAAPAIKLFVQRASAVDPSFSLTSGNAKAVAQICRRFDGLPLGIELAAAQCRLLTPGKILLHFTRRLDVPARNATDVPTRHKTLHDAVEWGHGLLTGSEQTLFRRIAIFSGGFTLAAAKAVASMRGELVIRAANDLARLQAKSLLQVFPRPGGPRYSMLETIREYALDRLATSPEHDEIHKAHSEYYLALAENGATLPNGRLLNAWLGRCDLELDNLRAALEDMLERGEGEYALRMGRALYRYWDQRERTVIAQRTLLKVLNRFEPLTAPALWSQVACYAGAMECRLGRLEAAVTLCERALAVALECKDPTAETVAINCIAVLHGYTPHPPKGTAPSRAC